MDFLTRVATACSEIQKAEADTSGDHQQLSEVCAAIIDTVMEITDGVLQEYCIQRT